MKVRVTQEHIDRGVRYDAACCPIALAMREGGLLDPAVAPGSCGWKDGEAPLPAEADRFIEDFDHGKKVWPFEFDLEVPA